jgi:hypothetical protein
VPHDFSQICTATSLVSDMANHNTVHNGHHKEAQQGLSVRRDR